MHPLRRTVSASKVSDCTEGKAFNAHVFEKRQTRNKRALPSGACYKSWLGWRCTLCLEVNRQRLAFLVGLVPTLRNHTPCFQKQGGASLTVCLPLTQRAGLSDPGAVASAAVARRGASKKDLPRLRQQDPGSYPRFAIPPRLFRTAGRREEDANWQVLDWKVCMPVRKKLPNSAGWDRGVSSSRNIVAPQRCLGLKCFFRRRPLSAISLLKANWTGPRRL